MRLWWVTVYLAILSPLPLHGTVGQVVKDLSDKGPCRSPFFTGREPNGFEKTSTEMDHICNCFGSKCFFVAVLQIQRGIPIYLTYGTEEGWFLDFSIKDLVNRISSWFSDVGVTNTITRKEINFTVKRIWLRRGTANQVPAVTYIVCGAIPSDESKWSIDFIGNQANVHHVSLCASHHTRGIKTFERTIFQTDHKVRNCMQVDLKQIEKILTETFKAAARVRILERYPEIGKAQPIHKHTGTVAWVEGIDLYYKMKNMLYKNKDTKNTNFELPKLKTHRCLLRNKERDKIVWKLKFAETKLSKMVERCKQYREDQRDKNTFKDTEMEQTRVSDLIAHTGTIKYARQSVPHEEGSQIQEGNKKRFKRQNENSSEQKAENEELVSTDFENGNTIPGGTKESSQFYSQEELLTECTTENDAQAIGNDISEYKQAVEHDIRNKNEEKRVHAHLGSWEKFSQNDNAGVFANANPKEDIDDEQNGEVEVKDEGPDQMHPEEVLVNSGGVENSQQENQENMAKENQTGDNKIETIEEVAAEDKGADEKDGHHEDLPRGDETSQNYTPDEEATECPIDVSEGEEIITDLRREEESSKQENEDELTNESPVAENKNKEKEEVEVKDKAPGHTHSEKVDRVKEPAPWDGSSYQHSTGNFHPASEEQNKPGKEGAQTEHIDSDSGEQDFTKDTKHYKAADKSEKEKNSHFYYLNGKFKRVRINVRPEREKFNQRNSENENYESTTILSPSKENCAEDQESEVECNKDKDRPNETVHSNSAEDEKNQHFYYFNGKIKRVDSNRLNEKGRNMPLANMHTEEANTDSAYDENSPEQENQNIAETGGSIEEPEHEKSVNNIPVYTHPEKTGTGPLTTENSIDEEGQEGSATIPPSTEETDGHSENKSDYSEEVHVTKDPVHTDSADEARHQQESHQSTNPVVPQNELSDQHEVQDDCVGMEHNAELENKAEDSAVTNGLKEFDNLNNKGKEIDEQNFENKMEQGVPQIGPSDEYVDQEDCMGKEASNEKFRSTHYPDGSVERVKQEV